MIVQLQSFDPGFLGGRGDAGLREPLPAAIVRDRPGRRVEGC